MSSNPRKRPAPGASPIVPVQSMQQAAYAPAQTDPALRWNGAAEGNNFSDPNTYGMLTQAQYRPGILAANSTALARRGMSQALVPTGPRPGFDAGSDAWNGFGDDGFMQGSNGADDQDSIEVLEERAQRAKREAQAKRKQIPPFVQKLSSFLDESQNTDLIRWSDKGDSFVVLDEDEFAKTLIPELFKHNNYASFVRQLNMYGFHKRVGLSDNSMKASERKNKSPSEYYNPYFKRGHPNLLWLINKPKSSNSKKKSKKDEGEPDSDDEGPVDEVFPSQNLSNVNQLGTRGAVAGEVGPLQKKDLVQVKAQIDQLQQQQLAISNLIERLRRDHNQLVTQALMFQNMHERHENSINAILNFLANVFRKSLEEQGGAQSVSDLLASIIPNAQQMPQGSVVDLDDFDPQIPKSTTVSPPTKRPQKLLPPIPNQSRTRSSASYTPTSTSAGSKVPSYQGTPQTGQVTELFDASPSDTSSPAYIKNELQTNPQQGMMKIIHDTNSAGGASPQINLPDMASKTSVSMTQDQRNKMLNIMAGRPTSAGGSTPNADFGNNGNPMTALSPLLSSIPPPSTADLMKSQAELSALEQLQRNQASKLDELSSLLGPLSPSGRIPGIDEVGDPTAGVGGPYFDGGDGQNGSGNAKFDLDQYLDPNVFGDLNSYGTGDFGGVDGSDFNFSLESPGGGAGSGVVDFGTGAGSGGGAAAGGGGLGPGSQGLEAGSAAQDTPSPAVTEEIARNDLDLPPQQQKSPEPSAKRRRA